MKYIRPNATLIALMSEDVITASIGNAVEIQQGDFNMGQKDEISFDDLIG